MKSTLAPPVAPAKHFLPPDNTTNRLTIAAHTTTVCIRAIFMAIGPAGICGISVGATAIILTQADPALHRTFLAIVWSAAVIISSVIVTGLVLMGRQSRDEF